MIKVKYADGTERTFIDAAEAHRIVGGEYPNAKATTKGGKTAFTTTAKDDKGNDVETVHAEVIGKE